MLCATFGVRPSSARWTRGRRQRFTRESRRAMTSDAPRPGFQTHGWVLVPTRQISPTAVIRPPTPCRAHARVRTMPKKSPKSPRRSRVQIPKAERERNATYGRRFQELSRKVLARDGYRCRVRSPRCIGKATVTDHIIPWQVGGAKWDMANLRASCKPCNAFRATEDGREWERSGAVAGVDVLAGRCPHVASDNRWCWEAGPGGGPLDGHHTRRWPMPESLLEAIGKLEPAKAARIRAKLAAESGAAGVDGGVVIA
jgi:5-methylcytosine-specific restriction endonuclease McrA